MTASFNISQLANKVNTSGQLDASTGLYNQVPEANGGTGASSLASVAVTSITAGTGIGLTGGPTGAVTITNTGGAGGATESTSATNITLTNASNRAQRAGFTATDKGFTLPDATTMTTLGYPIFALSNKGYYDASIYASDGGKIGALYAGSTQTLGLSNSSSATNGWFGADAMNLLCYANASVTLPTSLPTATSYDSADSKYWNVSPLSSTAFIMAYVDSAFDTYAVVGTVSGTTITFGTPVLINASGGDVYINVIGLSATAALVGHGTTGMAYHGLTISGNTITTVSTASSTITSISLPSITKVDSTRAIIGYTTSTANSARIVTFNGASAPTLGTAVTLISASWNTSTETMASFALIDTDKVVAFYSDSETSTSLYFGDFARVCSISGTTITLGGQTQLSTSTTTGGSANTQAIPISTTEAVCTNGYAVSVSGTTVTSLITAGQNQVFTTYRNTQGIAYLGSNNLISRISINYSNIGGTDVNTVALNKYASPYIETTGNSVFLNIPSFSRVIALDSTTAIACGSAYGNGYVNTRTQFGACVIKTNL